MFFYHLCYHIRETEFNPTKEDHFHILFVMLYKVTVLLTSNSHYTFSHFHIGEAAHFHIHFVTVVTRKQGDKVTG